MKVQLTKFAKYNSLVFFAFILIISQSACKKDPKPALPGTTGTRSELTKDSIFLYAKDTYLWNTLLPTYETFNPRKFTSKSTDLDNFDDELAAIKTYAPLDKYSFVDDGTVSSELGGVGGDYGFSVFYNSSDDLRIKYISPTSPAADKGLKRGYQITKINGRTDLIGSVQANINFVVDAIFGDHPSVSITVRKFDNTTEDVTVNKGSYSINPVQFSKVYTVGAKKVGYIVFSSFTTNASSVLDNVFTEFANANVSELIIDLRYNGGGSVSTADVLTNLIAPASKTGSLMYTTFWTKTMQDGQASILVNQPLFDNAGHVQPYKDGVNGKFATYADLDYSPTSADNMEKFAKRGNLNVSRVYFIVTGSTASASELVINNLKPVLDVKLIGRKTYGKPVGFFPIHIDQIDLYIPQFQTKNSLSQGDYFTGMTVDKEDLDDITKEFGDPSERYLSYALNFAEKGTFSVTPSGGPTISSVKKLTASEADMLTQELDRTKFKGMINDRLLKFK
ncbi:MAG: hypothetical protein JWN56_2898 [Sphingobacteriales bacterium]|nr:hypothetical protein [Sphingobacteriales bacterium]